MKYHDALRYLYGLIDYEKRRIERYTPREFKIERMIHLLNLLGNPHRDYPTVHIAGTKGKGSVSAMLAATAQAAGLRTALYTSPHLHTYRERMQIDREPISRARMTDLVEEIKPVIAQVPGVTTFEATTALAFRYFSQEKVDVAVVEVGLGGRLDATNVIMPLVSVITSLSFDHTALLGSTLPEIAHEKAGIIKPGVPVVTSPQKPEALAVLRTIADERNAPLIDVATSWTWGVTRREQHKQAITVNRTGQPSPFDGEYELALIGNFQQENATTAIATAAMLYENGHDWANPSATHAGLRQTSWPGRMEVLCSAPLLVVDSAHNAYSTQQLVKSLPAWFPETRWVLIYGASADKDIDGMLQALLPISDYIIVTKSYHPRAATPLLLADKCADLGKGAEVTVNPKRALEYAVERLEPGCGIIATGSVFLVADVREAWAERINIELPMGDWVDEPW